MHKGGRTRARITAARARRLLRGAPVNALAGLARIAVASAVVAAPSAVVGVIDDVTVRPTAAVTPMFPEPWPTVPSAKAPSPLAEAVGPPPPAVVFEPGRLHIPPVALAAYRNADGLMARTHPGCGLSWNLLAGIGQIESRHAFGGAVDHRGTAVDPIFGPALDGTLPGNEIIVASRANGRTVYVRAMGPMQFLPTTWAVYEADGDHDGRADPQNLFDATLAAARYLCSSGVDLRDRSALIGAVLRYNNSMAYTHNVLGWAQAYATGVGPGHLPSMTPVRSAPARPVAATAPAPAPPGGTLAPSQAESDGNRPTVRRTGTNTGASSSSSGTSSSNGSSSTGSSAGSSSGSSSGGARSSGGGLRTGPSGSGSSPSVKIGNGRTGGAR